MLLTGEIKDGQKVETDAGKDTRLVFLTVKAERPRKENTP